MGDFKRHIVNKPKIFIRLIYRVSLVALVFFFTNSNADEKQTKMQSTVLTSNPIHFDGIVVLGVVVTSDKSNNYAWLSYNNSKAKAYHIGQRLINSPEISVKKISINKVVFKYGQKLVERKISGNSMFDLNETLQNSLIEEEEEMEEDRPSIENTVLVRKITTQYLNDYSEQGEKEEEEITEVEVSVDTAEVIVYQNFQRDATMIPSIDDEEETEE